MPYGYRGTGSQQPSAFQEDCPIGTVIIYFCIPLHRKNGRMTKIKKSKIFLSYPIS